MRKQTKLVAALSATALLAVGASMTSFAAGWTEIGDGEYVYLDSDGERVTSEWRRSGSDYFFLDENGEIAKSRLITPNDGDTDAYYYVNSVGARLKSQWVRVVNEENETVNDQEPEMFWYYLGANGKAYRNDDTGEDDYKKYSISYNGTNRTFFFDTEGRMVTGWIQYTEKDGTENYYYCTPDDPTRGYAETDWWQLEVPDDWDEDGKEYDVVEWFNFDSNGKARRATETGKPKVWYKDGWYYAFDRNGVMLDDWYGSNLTATSNVATGNSIATDPTASAFSSYYGTKQGSGWVYTDVDDDGEYDYYYLVTYSDGVNNKVRNVAFNSFNNDGLRRAKAIDGKIYLFDKDGKMMDGRVVVTDDDTVTTDDEYDDKTVWGGVAFRKLPEGTYFFNNGSEGVKGQMMTGKRKVVVDGDDYWYYFDKQTGVARTNEVIDGCLYGDDGELIKADDGNNAAIVELDANVVLKKDSKGVPTEIISKGSTVIVTSGGKIKTSTSGYTKIDGEQYHVVKDGTKWTVEPKEDKDK